MAFFRSFLTENSQTPDTAFAERDEAALVWFLIQARVRNSAVGLGIPADFEAPERLPANFAKEMKFVAGFVCFFVAKPMQYMREMNAFRNYFIPGFSGDEAKQIQLAQALRENFFHATLADLQGTTTLDLFFDVNEIMAIARH
jgi:hypothetical protein